jgi:hypothetical protein
VAGKPKLPDQVRQLLRRDTKRSYDEEIQQEETENAEIQYRSPTLFALFAPVNSQEPPSMASLGSSASSADFSMLCKAAGES